MVSIKDTEYKIPNAIKKPLDELLKAINEVLKTHSIYQETITGDILGFWIDEDGTLYIGKTKCIKADSKHLNRVKNEALINNQYSIYNNETGQTLNIILPIYTIYNTSDLLGTPNTQTLANYSRDFIKLDDIINHLNIEATRGTLSKYIFDSVDNVPVDYQYNKIIIKDLSNFTRDIIDELIDEPLDTIYKQSILLEA